MKRQDSSSSLLSPWSSSRRQRSPEKLHAKTIGCMSGLFRLLSKYQNRRKFLTFGKKHEKCVSSPPKNVSKSAREEPIGDTHNRRFSCDVPRSPTLPAEIRRSNSVNSPENYRTPPALVARLMGLDSDGGESAAEKREKLLGALERCDRDLKALKRIIEAVQSQPPPPPRAVGGCGAEKLAAETRRSSELIISGEQPSPVSVLDELTRSPLCSYTRRSHATATAAAAGRDIAQPLKKRPGGEEDTIKLSLLDRIMNEYFQTRSSVKAVSASPTLSMVESVNEACNDVAWGEKREVGRIGVALQDLICRDLIEEFVKEITCPRYNCVYSKSLPFEACKRKLRF